LVAELYQYYGDERIVRESYEAATRWVDRLKEHAEGYIIDRCIGDHESLDPKPIAVIATAHFYQAARLVERFARILDRGEDTERYRTLAGQIRAAFIDRFLDAGTGRFDLGTQACQATALYMGLVPDAARAAATERMVDQVLREHDGHIATGIFGTKYLLESLAEAGRADVAYEIVNQKTFPGWGYMLEMGATTLWEHWELSEDVYSHNHPMFGSVSEWFFKALGGIKPDAQAIGFDRFALEPNVVGDLTWVETRYESVRGTIVSNWRLDGDRLILEIEIPVNTTARVRVPTRDPSSVTEGGRPASDVPGVRRLASTSTNAAFFELGSGHYELEAVAPPTA
jgi:alpha-L-rhamnosidase